jgi:hypothetical protein
MFGLILPMSLGAALQMPPVKLMNALRGDDATLFTGQSGSNFFPRPAPLSLFADKFHEWFKPAVKSPSASRAFSFHRRSRIDVFQIHQRTA